MANFTLSNGMTIQIPQLTNSNDQLFVNIKNYFDSRFTELTKEIQQLKSQTEQCYNLLRSMQHPTATASTFRFLNNNHARKRENGTNLYLKERQHISDALRRKRKFPNPRKRMDSGCSTFDKLNMIVDSRDCKTHEEKCDNLEDINETNSFLTNLSKTVVKDECFTEKIDELDYNRTGMLNIDLPDPLEPVIVYNPNDNREIFLGGSETVRLPLWAYKKCLTTIRGKPSELSSRLCLRLLQAKFGRKYMLTHNYNGSGDKAPIDRQVMSAILSQVKLQFPHQDDIQTNPARFAMFRDYINNAFRVVAYRHRKGIQSNTPFWDLNGEPITKLDPPSWMTDANT